MSPNDDEGLLQRSGAPSKWTWKRGGRTPSSWTMLTTWMGTQWKKPTNGDEKVRSRRTVTQKMLPRERRSQWASSVESAQWRLRISNGLLWDEALPSRPPVGKLRHPPRRTVEGNRPKVLPSSPWGQGYPCLWKAGRCAKAISEESVEFARPR